MGLFTAVLIKSAIPRNTTIVDLNLWLAEHWSEHSASVSEPKNVIHSAEKNDCLYSLSFYFLFQHVNPPPPPPPPSCPTSKRPRSTTRSTSRCCKSSANGAEARLRSARLSLAYFWHVFLNLSFRSDCSLNFFSKEKSFQILILVLEHRVQPKMN